MLSIGIISWRLVGTVPCWFIRKAHVKIANIKRILRLPTPGRAVPDLGHEMPRLCHQLRQRGGWRTKRRSKGLHAHACRFIEDEKAE